MTLASREAYLQFVANRNDLICILVAEHGINKTAELTGWSKPTVISIVRKTKPELLRKFSSDENGVTASNLHGE